MDDLDETTRDAKHLDAAPSAGGTWLKLDPTSPETRCKAAAATHDFTFVASDLAAVRDQAEAPAAAAAAAPGATGGEDAAVAAAKQQEWRAWLQTFLPTAEEAAMAAAQQDWQSWLLRVKPAAGRGCWQLVLDPAAGMGCWRLTDPASLAKQQEWQAWLQTLLPTAEEVAMAAAQQGWQSWLLRVKPAAGRGCWQLVLDPAAGMGCWRLTDPACFTSKAGKRPVPFKPVVGCKPSATGSRIPRAPAVMAASGSRIPRAPAVMAASGGPMMAPALAATVARGSRTPSAPAMTSASHSPVTCAPAWESLAATPAASGGHVASDPVNIPSASASQVRMWGHPVTRGRYPAVVEMRSAERQRGLG
jgi:hypothetical protein